MDTQSAAPSLRATLALALVLTTGVQAPAQDLERVPGEADGPLPEALGDALRARDRVGPRWRGEAGVAAWTRRLEALLAGELADGLGQSVRFVDRRADAWRASRKGGPLELARRATAEDGSTATLSLAELTERLEDYAGGPTPDRRTKLKMVGVDAGSTDPDDGPWTEVLASAFAAAGGQRQELHARWRVRWTPGDPEEALPVELVWESEERARLDGTAPAFVDCTASAFADPLPEACVLGLGTWRRRLDSLLGTGLLGHQGLAVGDVDGDGWEDLYVCQPGGLPNRLFLSGPGGVLEDASAGSGADFLDRSASALLVHLDDDEHLDLALATEMEVLLLRGDGSGAFELAGRHEASTTTSMAASDFDLDGDLDLYLCGYVSPYNDSATPLPYHDANNGERNQLLRNEGDWQFADVTDAVGLDAHNRRFSFAASWADFDRDGDPDLYVANDFGRNNLYRNDDGQFVDVARELGVEDIAAGMGVAWGDCDNDGWEDLYVSNMFSAAGSRVGYEPAFHAGAGGEALGAFRRHARGNTLFRNVGGERFEDVTAAAGVGTGRWAWGSLLFDMDDDGWLDVLVPNGMITGDVSDDL